MYQSWRSGREKRVLTSGIGQFRLIETTALNMGLKYPLGTIYSAFIDSISSDSSDFKTS
jgi:hypothetical protein